MSHSRALSAASGPHGRPLLNKSGGIKCIPVFTRPFSYGAETPRWAHPVWMERSGSCLAMSWVVWQRCACQGATPYHLFARSPGADFSTPLMWTFLEGDRRCSRDPVTGILDPPPPLRRTVTVDRFVCFSTLSCSGKLQNRVTGQTWSTEGVLMTNY